MDQGVIAVLGAGVGVVGGLGTAALTYVAARRQAMDNGKMSHWQMLRDERKQAYLSFLSAVEEFQFQASRFPEYFLLAPLDGAVEAAGRAAGEQLAELYKTCNRVELAGPVQLSDLAGLLRNESEKVFWRLEDHVRRGEGTDSRSIEEFLLMLDELSGRHREFVRSARRLLETKPSY